MALCPLLHFQYHGNCSPHSLVDIRITRNRSLCPFVRLQMLRHLLFRRRFDIENVTRSICLAILRTTMVLCPLSHFLHPGNCSPHFNGGYLHYPQPVIMSTHIISLSFVLSTTSHMSLCALCTGYVINSRVHYDFPGVSTRQYMS